MYALLVHDAYSILTRHYWEKKLREVSTSNNPIINIGDNLQAMSLNKWGFL